MRNHGTLALGSSAAEAWSRIYGLERACTAQVRALSAGREGVLIAPKAAQEEVARQIQRFSTTGEERNKRADLGWEAIRRKVERHSPGYDA